MGQWFMIIEFYRTFFGSIPGDFGNRGESTITNLPKRNKQWQKHRKKDQTTANRTTAFFYFYEVGTAVWPREFYHGNLLSKQSSKIPVAIPRFLHGEKRWKHRHSIRRGLVFLKVLLPSFIPHLVILLWLIHRHSRNRREFTRRPCEIWVAD